MGLPIAAQTLRTSAPLTRRRVPWRSAPWGLRAGDFALGRHRARVPDEIDRGRPRRGAGVDARRRPPHCMRSAAKGPDNVFSVRADGGRNAGIDREARVQSGADHMDSGRPSAAFPRLCPSEARADIPSADPPSTFRTWPKKASRRRWSQVPRDFGGADLSPDGHWLAYDSEDCGERHVFVDAYPGPGPRFQVSSRRRWWLPQYGAATVESCFTCGRVTPPGDDGGGGDVEIVDYVGQRQPPNRR